jgi:hypothetical protein
MRMMLKITVPVEKGNAGVQDGTVQRVIQETTEKLKPEAVYFVIQDGQRASFIFFDMAESPDVVSICEPIWMALDCDLELAPAMNLEDLQTGMQRAFG